MKLIRNLWRDFIAYCSADAISSRLDYIADRLDDIQMQNREILYRQDADAGLTDEGADHAD